MLITPLLDMISAQAQEADRTRSVSADVIDAINDDPFASSIMRASLVTGTESMDVSGSDFNFSLVDTSSGIS